MCNSPLYRLLVENLGELPKELQRRVKGGGIIISRKEYEYFRNIHRVPSDYIQTIPCGKCLGCKVDYQNLWATRIQLETSNYANNYFLTLTYNEDNVPKSLQIDPVTGKTHFYNVLVKKELSRFVKRLRRLLDYRKLDKIKVLCAGEYGDNGLRPHFHIIACNLNLPDLEFFYYKGRKGAWKLDYETGDEVYYRSNIVEKAWGKGFCLVTRVTPNNCSYVASYVNKKVTPSEIKDNLNAETFYTISRDFGRPCSVTKLCGVGALTSPFLHMSRRNGLGFTSFGEKERAFYFQFDKIKPRKGVSLYVKHCRYFDSLLEKEDSESYAMFKAIRGRNNYKPNYRFWDNSDLLEMSKREERLLINQSKKKKREL